MNKSIAQLADTILSQIQPDKPFASEIATRVQPVFAPKALIFDIFRTLVRTNNVQDIELPSIVQQVAQAFGRSMSVADAHAMVQLYRSNIGILQAKSRLSVGMHGEISVADAWQLAFAQTAEPLTYLESEDFAFLYSLQSTRPHPMPGMQELIAGRPVETRLSRSRLPSRA